MAQILRVKARWAGFTGSPGWSNFFFAPDLFGPVVQADADSAAAKVRAFFDTNKGMLPPAVTITVQPDVEVIEASNGVMENILTVAPPAAVTGIAASASYSAPTGLVITWRTAGVRNGRRVRGRTFLVPVASLAFENNGTLAPAWQNTLQTAGNTLLAEAGSPDFGIWARPSGPGATDGSWHKTTAATVPDLAAVLRSRRD